MTINTNTTFDAVIYLTQYDTYADYLELCKELNAPVEMNEVEYIAFYNDLWVYDYFKMFGFVADDED